MPDITYGRWSPTEVMERVLDGTWVAATEELGGMVLLTPTSIAYSGTSASIGANGSVTFTAVTSLSLNGVFSATYDNYMIVIRSNNTAGLIDIQARLRASGTDASGSNYVVQSLYAQSTTVAGSRGTLTSAALGRTTNVLRDGTTVWVYGPNLAQPTAFRNTSVNSTNNARIYDYANTHSLSTAYDGITFIGEAGFSFNGLVSVYGLKGA